MPGSTGVLAVQGDFEKHIHTLARLGEESIEVRTPEELDRVDRLIIPGGESTTVALLLQRFGLGDEIIRRANEGMPVWGTCMGMILMARSIEGRPNQWSLGLLDIEVRRNAFGRQIHSFESPVPLAGREEPVMGVFIRAPVVTEKGDSVETLSEIEGQVVAVRQGSKLGTSYHPELTEETAVHELFLSMPSNR